MGIAEHAPIQPPDDRKNSRLRFSLDVSAFRGSVEANDDQTVEFWRRASPADHARAMSELSIYAENMVRITGLNKPPDEDFPDIRQLLRPETAK